MNMNTGSKSIVANVINGGPGSGPHAGGKTYGEKAYVSRRFAPTKGAPKLTHQVRISSQDDPTQSEFHSAHPSRESADKVAQKLSDAGKPAYVKKLEFV